MKHYPFPKIRQFHQVIKDLKLKHQFVGLDAEGNAIYDHTKPLPKIKFIGRVKLHGTNAAIVIKPSGKFYCQSRENIITEEKDNAGFAHWARKEFTKIAPTFSPQLTGEELLVIYGEWCGGSIQAGVALNQLPKMFVVFGAKQVDVNGRALQHFNAPVYNAGDSSEFQSISRVPTYEIEVDLDRPDKAIEIMNDMVDKIDKECPFAKTFGVSGHGEGIVFRPEGDNSFQYAFKVKGESHSVSNIRKLPTVDVQKLDSIEKALEDHCHEDRLEQGYASVVKTPEDETPTKIGEFTRWVVNDIWEEEGDSLVGSDISRKDMGSAVSKKAARWFQNKLQATA